MLDVLQKPLADARGKGLGCDLSLQTACNAYKLVGEVAGGQIDANAYQHSRAVRRAHRLTEYAADLAAVQVQVVDPFDGGGRAGQLLNGERGCPGGRTGQPRKVAKRCFGVAQKRHIKPRAVGRVEATPHASASCGLLACDDQRALALACGGDAARLQIGGIDAVKDLGA